MMSYDALPALLQAVIMLGLYLSLCGSIYMLISAIRRKSLPFAVPTLLCVLLNGGMTILYSADVRSKKHGYVPSAVSRWFCEKPVLFAILLFIVMGVFLIYSVMWEARLHKTNLTPSAIKESIDHLPTGLCFYAENGRVLLVNHRMNQLVHVILGRDLQNAALMWDDLCKGNVQEDIVQLWAGTQPGFRLPDGTVWTFSRTDLQGVLQITAADTTQLQGLVDELEQKNISLAALQERLKQYEKNVEELARAKELLETKADIHSELGQALLATRSYLMSDNPEKQVPLEAWKRSIALLRKMPKTVSERPSLQMLIQTADAFGVTVHADGQFPEQEAAGQLFLEAALEALTNAVRHAGAKTLYIRFSETDPHHLVSFQNDGCLPVGEITEGGGLTSLRRKVETAGGSMSICCQPEYILTITVPKEIGGEYI